MGRAGDSSRRRPTVPPKSPHIPAGPADIGWHGQPSATIGGPRRCYARRRAGATHRAAPRPGGPRGRGSPRTQSFPRCRRPSAIRAKASVAAPMVLSTVSFAVVPPTLIWQVWQFPWRSLPSSTGPPPNPPSCHVPGAGDAVGHSDTVCSPHRPVSRGPAVVGRRQPAASPPTTTRRGRGTHPSRPRTAARAGPPAATGHPVPPQPSPRSAALTARRPQKPTN